MFEVELEDVIVESKFDGCQIEITGVCNMRCAHCRAWEEERSFLSLETFNRILDFAEAERVKGFRLTLSGGEPFIHPELISFLKSAKEKKIENVAITTNGSISSPKTLLNIKNLEFPNLFIQVSIDSTNPVEHDNFRGHKNAFKRAMKFFEVCRELKINTSLRSSITPKNISEMEDFAQLAIEVGAMRVAYSSVIPAGRAKCDVSLLMNAENKKIFIEQILYLKNKCLSIDVTTEDPLKVVHEKSQWYSKAETPYTYGGCTAGISCFNVYTNGDVSPCAVFNAPILNIHENESADGLRKKYSQSKIIKDLFARNFSGACSRCNFKFSCGGCRAMPYGLTGDYTGQDPTCFLGAV